MDLQKFSSRYFFFLKVKPKVKIALIDNPVMIFLFCSTISRCFSSIGTSLIQNGELLSGAYYHMNTKSSLCTESLRYLQENATYSLALQQNTDIFSKCKTTVGHFEF